MNIRLRSSRCAWLVALGGNSGKFLGGWREVFVFLLASWGRFFLGLVAISCLEAWSYGEYNLFLARGACGRAFLL